MGWASGGVLLESIILSTQKAIPKKYRKALYVNFIEHFEYHDCDVVCELRGIDPEFDAAMSEVHPEWFEEEEDE